MTVIRKTKYKNKKYSRMKNKKRSRINKFQKGSGEHMNLPSQNIQKRKEAENLKLQEQIRVRAKQGQPVQPVQPVQPIMLQPIPPVNKQIISKIKFALMQR